MGAHLKCVAEPLDVKKLRKIGRNDLCPCGSGKKFKHCCGAAVAKAPKGQISSVPPNAKEFTTKSMGLPAQAGDLHAINRFAEGDPRNDIPLQGAEGWYRVTFVLVRPGYNLVSENRYSFASGLRGNSHLAITKPAFTPPDNPDADRILIYSRTKDGEFRFKGYPNAEGFLGKVESFEFKARSRDDAKKKAYRALTPSLSNWSIHLDIPLEVYQIDTLELATGSKQMSMTNPYWEAPFAVAPSAEMKPEFRGYAALYREALGSNTPVYRFLCFYKIVEGIQDRRRRLATEARLAQREPARYKEFLPSAQDEIRVWLNAIFPVRRNWDAMTLDTAVPPDVRGKRFSAVIHNTLRPLRVDIAHALSSASGELTLSADELLHVQRVNMWLSMTKCIVRRMLKNEFPTEFLSYLNEDGTFKAVSG